MFSDRTGRRWTGRHRRPAVVACSSSPASVESGMVDAVPAAYQRYTPHQYEHPTHLNVRCGRCGRHNPARVRHDALAAQLHQGSCRNCCGDCRGWKGQVRGVARMIERDEYCIDILQQTAALRAAVDAVSLLLDGGSRGRLPGHCRQDGRGAGLHRRGDGSRAPEHGPAGKGANDRLTQGKRGTASAGHGGRAAAGQQAPAAEVDARVRPHKPSRPTNFSTNRPALSELVEKPVDPLRCRWRHCPPCTTGAPSGDGAPVRVR